MVIRRTTRKIIKLGRDIGVRKFATPEEKRKVEEVESKQKKKGESTSERRARERKETKKKPVLKRIVEAISTAKRSSGVGVPRTQAENVFQGVGAAAKLAAVGGGIAAAGGLGGLTAAGGSAASITEMKSAHAINTLTGKLMPRGTVQTQRSFVGRPASSGVDKIFNAGNRAVATQFASNTKSAGLTTSFIKKTGATLTNPGVLISIIGTYPFAGFIKEEALQTLSFATKTAMDAGDLEGAQIAIDEQQEIIDAIPGIIDKVPFANIVKQLETFYKAAQTKINIDRNAIEQQGQILSGDVESEFEKSRSEARQTQLEERERDAEYFALIREGKFEEAEELLQSELKGGN